ncbi:MAG: 16S rRNA (cytosine(967)-C(5))-methyltransferase RsmB [Bradymonadales bacterium]|nr:16S rRNA (cytosine(967)-C(5))-methyltransferase RsmB [Bradymonadales bacterium]
MPREAAIRAIEAVEMRHAFSNIALDSQIRKRGLHPQDIALATEITYGVLKNLRFLDELLSPFLRLPLENLNSFCRSALRVGAYQLLFLDRIPDHAALFETVNAVKRNRHRYTGLVNAVLRQVARRATPLKESLEGPITSISQLASRYSLPDDLAAGIVDRFGLEEATAYAQALQERPPVTLRVRDPVRRAEVVEKLRTAGISAVPTIYAPSGILITQGGAPAELEAVIERQAVVQDEASQLVGWYCAAQPGEQVADLCAGRGGKSFHLADLMNNQGMILATDLATSKLVQCRNTARRLGCTIIHTWPPLAEDSRLLEEPADGNLDDRAFLPPDPSLADASHQWSRWPLQDLVLLDAPCSGSGVMRRHPEIRWRLKPSRLEELTRLQAVLLEGAAPLVRPGGHLVYAVCSDLPGEGLRQIDRFLSLHPEFQRDPPPTQTIDWADLTSDRGDLVLLTHRHHTDGFFACRLVRND